MSSGSIGRYQLIEEIGRGGMATVYRAHDPRFKRDVAIKLMTRDLLEDPTLKARFEREAQTIAALEHPAIVPVYDFGEEDGRPYLVMRLMDARTLEHRLQKGALSITETSAILNRIGSALERAHEKGIVHRDLKPSNIMFDDYGDAFLADFGIARLTESSITLTGDSVIGTPAYMSPEQIHGDKAIDGRSDIYALGVICFEMLTGQRPYVDSTPAKVMMRHIMDPVPDIRQVKPDLPEGVEAVIAHTMAKNPDERYQSPREMTDTLSTLSRSIAETAPAAAKPAEPDQPAEEAAPVVGVSAAAAAAAIESQKETAVDQPAAEMQMEIDAGSEYPETEVAAPSFVETEAPETDVAAPSFVEAEVPYTEVAVPSFAAQIPSQQDLTSSETAPAAAETRSGLSGNWLLIAGIGIIGVIVVGLVIGGGFLLFNQLSDDGEGEIPADSEDSQAALQPTRRPTTTIARPADTGESVDQGVDESRFIEAEDQMTRFYRAMENENWDEAMAAVEQAVSLVPEEPWYLHEQAFLLYSLEEYDPALAIISQAVEMAPDAGENYDLRSRILLKMGNSEAALEDGLRALEWDGASDANFATLGDIYFELGDHEHALEAFGRAIEMNPENAEHLNGRAQVLEAVGEYEAAAGDLARAFELDPEATGYLEQLGSIALWSLEDPQWALEIYSQLVELQPDNAWYHFHQGEALREMGEFEDSLAAMSTAIELEPSEPWFYVELAWMHYNTGNVDEAIANFDKAIEIAPEAPDIFHTRASFYHYELGELERALEDYSRAIELDPESGYHYLDRAELYKDLGDYDAAIADLEMALSRQADDPWIHISYGDLILELGDIDGALLEYERAVELDPHDADLYQHKANKLWELGDPVSALHDFQRCIEINPGYPWCHLDMAWLYDELGDIAAAVENFQLFIENVDPAECPECYDEAQNYIDQNR